MILIQLYKAGNTHVVRGIKCTMQNFDEYSYLHLLKQGWHYRPEDINGRIDHGVQIKERREEKTNDAETVKERKEEKEDGLLKDIENGTLKELKAIAKKFKVPYSKRVGTKMKLLNKDALKKKLLEKVKANDDKN